MSFKKNILTKLSQNQYRILTTTINTLLWIVMIGIWYAILAFTVDMPAEYKLRHSTDVLRAEYTKMSIRYDELAEVMDNVIARDENVFRKLFESNPYDLTIDDEQERIELHESLMSMENDELMELLDNRVQSAEQEKDILTRSYEDMMYAYQTTTLSIDCIPAIQPADNSG